MVMRITNNRLVMTVLRNLNRNVTELETLQDHLSSGKRIRFPSDDPLGLAQALALDSNIAQNTQFTKNIDTGLSWLELTDSNLNSSVDLLQRARELAVQGANDTETAESRKAIAKEIDELFKQVLQIANSNQGGTYLFAGHETRTQPFVQNTDSDGLQSISYLGDNGQRICEIGPKIVVPVNVPGDDAFMVVMKHSITGSAELNELDQPLDTQGLVPAPTAGTFTLTVNEKTTQITVDPTVDSLEDLVDRINSSAAKVTASIVDTNGKPPYSLKLESQVKGDDGRIIVTSQTSNVMRSLGLATSLNPMMSGGTALDELNSGNGVSVGSFQISDRSGVTYGPITVNLGDTVANIIAKISAASGGVITAAIAPTGDRLTLTDTSTPPSVQPRNLIVEDLGGGRTAEDLGILFDVPANSFTGDKVFHLAASTNLADLNGGAGMTFTEIRIENDEKVVTVDLSADYDGNGTLEINDLIQAINDSGVDVKARVNQQGDRLEIYSTIPGSRLNILQSVPPGQSLGDLGFDVEEKIPKNVFQVLIDLRNALNSDNREKISASLTEIDEVMDHILAKDSEVGARVNRMELSQTRLSGDVINLKTRLTKIEDIDITEAIMKLKMQESVYRSSLSVGSRVILPTLMDFL